MLLTCRLSFLSLVRFVRDWRKSESWIWMRRTSPRCLTLRFFLILTTSSSSLNPESIGADPLSARTHSAFTNVERVLYTRPPGEKKRREKGDVRSSFFFNKKSRVGEKNRLSALHGSAATETSGVVRTTEGHTLVSYFSALEKPVKLESARQLFFTLLMKWNFASVYQKIKRYSKNVILFIVKSYI